MATPRIKAVRILKNHGARVTTESTRAGTVHRYVPPDGSLTTFEAARLLGTYPTMVTRMALAGVIGGEPDASGRLMVPVADLRHLMREAPARRVGVPRARRGVA
jgi:hypothetical protein